MQLRYRETKLDDLPACLNIIRDGFLYNATLKSDLLRLWRDLLTRRYGHSVVIENEGQPKGSRLVGFGISGFVTDEFVREIKSGSSPYIARQALDRSARGNSPFLTLKDMRRANSAEGLNCCVLHYGMERFQRREDILLSWQCLLEAFVDVNRGYRLKEVIQEMYGESDVQTVLSLGTTLWTDYAEALRNGVSPSPPPDRRPYLIVLRREEVLKDGHTPSTGIFVYTPPRFYFTNAEQELLYHALLGATDTELADRLRISLTAVKKRWNGIYERVSAVDTGLLAPADSTARAGKRGIEKRRHLLAYLRERPEELRPAIPPKTQAASKRTSRVAPAPNMPVPSRAVTNLSPARLGGGS